MALKRPYTDIMYIAPHAREDRPDVLLAAMHDIQFCTLVIAGDSGLTASHLPMVVKSLGDGDVLLEGHVARANMLWKASDKTPALAIFQGPNAYIHPGWYPSKQRDARVVPTWNYIAVHAHGALIPVEDQAWLRQHLEELTARNETHRAQPWSVSDAPADYLHRRMQAIVGLQLHVSAIEGNWKMAQKQPLENRLGAADGLSSSGDPQNAAVANIMNDLYDGEAS